MNATANQFWFPGNYVGGISMILAPVVFLTGVLLRIRFHFFFPDQLAAYKSNQELMFTSYSLFLLGNILLWPAIVSLAHLIGKKNRLGLFGVPRWFYSGCLRGPFMQVQITWHFK
jgi:hypothetical protein